jgi:hypothetical protein
MPRIAALHMLRSTITTVSAPASSSFRGSLPHPTHPPCTLRVRRHRRLTQHSLPGGLLSLTWAGLAPADRASFAWRLPLIDHLVGAARQCRRHLDAERLRRAQVDHKFNPGRLHDRQVGRFCALENAARIDAGLPVRIRNAGSVAHQAAGRGELAPFINRRRCMACCQHDELLAPDIEDWRGTDQERRGPLLGKGRKRGIHRTTASS